MKKEVNVPLIILIILVILLSSVRVVALDSSVNNKDLEMYEVLTYEPDSIVNYNVLEIYDNQLLEKDYQEDIIDLSIQQSLVDFAVIFNGNPYVMGGTSLTNGADCSGFIQTLFGYFGYYMPRTPLEQSYAGEQVTDEIIIGDIITYGYGEDVTHVALYIGNGEVIHASTPELGIRIDNMYMMPIINIRRII